MLSLRPLRPGFCCGTGLSCFISRPADFPKFCYQIGAVAVGWQVYALTGSALDLGMVGLVQFIPTALLTFAAGHVADRYSRKRVAQLSPFAALLAAAFLAWGSFSGWLSVPQIFAAVAVFGVAIAFESPAAAAILPAVGARRDDAKSGGALHRRVQMATIAGPALGGLIYAVAPGVPYTVSSCSLVFGRAAERSNRSSTGPSPSKTTIDDRRPVSRCGVRSQQSGNTRIDIARSVRRSVRQRYCAAADLRPGHPAYWATGARRFARRAGGWCAADGAGARPLSDQSPGRHADVPGRHRLRPRDCCIRALELDLAVASGVGGVGRGGHGEHGESALRWCNCRRPTRCVAVSGR